MERRRYFDNAATTFPKPPAVADAMQRFANELGASPGRGSYRESVESGEQLQNCRERLIRLFNGRDPSHVIFTLNASDALNLAIKGLINAAVERDGRAHAVTTWMDHNSVLRPLNALCEDTRITQTRVQADPETGIVNASDVIDAITPDTAIVSVVHASNVSGSVQPIGEIGAACRKRGVPFLVDAAQTLGHIPIDIDDLAIDLLAFPGHKGLLGPLGTGALYIRPGIEQRMHTIREGGTGSVSELDVQPDFMPDRFEPGSHNTIGLIGLAAGVEYVDREGIDTIAAHERALTDRMLDGLRRIDGLRILGPQTSALRVGVFSLVHDEVDPHTMANELESRFGILGRAGLHCAPLAHRTFGTEQSGALRLSLGPFHTTDDIDAAIDAVTQVAHAHANI